MSFCLSAERKDGRSTRGRTTRQTAQAKEKAMPRVPWRKGDLIGFFRKKTRIPINQRGFHRMSLVGLYI